MDNRENFSKSELPGPWQPATILLAVSMNFTTLRYCISTSLFISHLTKGLRSLKNLYMTDFHASKNLNLCLDNIPHGAQLCIAAPLFHTPNHPPSLVQICPSLDPLMHRSLRCTCVQKMGKLKMF
ncbi:zinc finger protein 382 isoform X8 [Rousettus aegyptiacus]|uniref:zinc finger protein 382 isoform X8 n=1 Tax=Rousettus aegyptiacus TaxID=9407 RepID=UPI00168CBD8F|nr:zinc finger protein 382 isoform X8 [Rousettus aegyptiacus]